MIDFVICHMRWQMLCCFYKFTERYHEYSARNWNKLYLQCGVHLLAVHSACMTLWDVCCRLCQIASTRRYTLNAQHRSHMHSQWTHAGSQIVQVKQMLMCWTLVEMFMIMTGLQWQNIKVIVGSSNMQIIMPKVS